MNQRNTAVRAIFTHAVEIDDERQRSEYLAQACGADTQLRRHVEDLIQANAAAGAFLGGAGDAAEPAVPNASAGTLLVTPITEKPGDKIGPYKLLQQIGEGGCGVVYMAEQEQPVRRKVALKVIKLGMDTKSVIARFEAERQALALMEHPHIARVLDAGATNTGRPYFVMELVRGLKITEHCDQYKLPTADRLNLFIQVCQAIQHAHQKGIIHRDIKPSNILVTLHDGVPVPKVIDFGIAKATQGKLTDQTLFTAFEQFIGTPAYMSPEQAEMSGLDIDTRSDVYALGVLLYELLTGQTPFDTKELMAAGLGAMRRTIREKDPSRPSTRLRTMLAADLTTVARQRQCEPAKLVQLLGGDLDWVVMKALEKDRTRRYESVNGLLTDIQRHFHNEPVVARPPSSSYRLHKLVLRNKLVVGGGAAVATVFLLGVLVSSLQATRAARAERKLRQSEANELLLRQDIAGKVDRQARQMPDMHFLEGVIDLPGRKCAIIMVLSTHHVSEWHILEEGQNDGVVEVLQIDSLTGVVKTRIADSSTNPTIVLKLSGQIPRHGIVLEDAGIRPVLALYQEFTGRTLLRWPDLPESSHLNLISAAADNGDAAAVLEKALATKQILAIPDGSKFIMVVPKSRAAIVKPRSGQLKPVASKEESESDLLPAGGLNFPQENIWRVAFIYAELLGRRLDTNGAPGGRLGWVSFKNQTALSRPEACYALETLFEWQGFKLLPFDKDLAKLAPIADSDSRR